MLSIHLRLVPPSGLTASGFPTNYIYTFLFSPIRATCPAHLVLYFIVLIILGWGQIMHSSLCNFLHPPVTSIPLWSKYSQHHVLKQPPIMFLPLMSETMFHTHIEPQANFIVLYILSNLCAFFYSRREGRKFLTEWCITKTQPLLNFHPDWTSIC
jgi:hypothetical protein